MNFYDMILNEYILMIIPMVYLGIVAEFSDRYFLLRTYSQMMYWRQKEINPSYEYDYIPSGLISGINWSIHIHAPIIIYSWIRVHENLLTAVSIRNLFLSILFQALIFFSSICFRHNSVNESFNMYNVSFIRFLQIGITWAVNSKILFM